MAGIPDCCYAAHASFGVRHPSIHGPQNTARRPQEVIQVPGNSRARAHGHPSSSALACWGQVASCRQAGTRRRASRSGARTLQHTEVRCPARYTPTGSSSHPDRSGHWSGHEQSKVQTGVSPDRVAPTSCVEAAGSGQGWASRPPGRRSSRPAPSNQRLRVESSPSWLARSVARLRTTTESMGVMERQIRREGGNIGVTTLGCEESRLDRGRQNEAQPRFLIRRGAQRVRLQRADKMRE